MGSVSVPGKIAISTGLEAMEAPAILIPSCLEAVAHRTISYRVLQCMVSLTVSSSVTTEDPLFLVVP